MKMKRNIFWVLLFSSLAGLIAEILSEDIYRYRSLNRHEQFVFDYYSLGVKANLRRICYIECRSVYAPFTTAQKVADPLLQEFYPDSTFDELYGSSMLDLVENFFVPSEDDPLNDTEICVYVWLMRKLMDRNYDVSQNPIMKDNMYYFYNSYPKIFLTIKRAIEKAKENLGTDEITTIDSDDIRTAFTCIDDPECLDYPTYFACSI